MTMTFFVWICINLVVPILGPIFLLVLLKASRGSDDINGQIVFYALKDGAMFWTVIAMSAGAIYDAGFAISDRQNLADSEKVGAWVSIAWHFLAIIGSSVLVLLGTMDTVRAPQVQSSSPDRRMYRLSIITTCATAFSYGSTHYAFS